MDSFRYLDTRELNTQVRLQRGAGALGTGYDIRAPQCHYAWLVLSFSQHVPTQRWLSRLTRVPCAMYRGQSNPIKRRFRSHHEEHPHRLPDMGDSEAPTLRRQSSSSSSLRKHPSYPRHDVRNHIGAEPGIDPRKVAAIEEYSHFKEDCVIDVIDYEEQEFTAKRMGNAEFIELMKQQGEGLGDEAKGTEHDLLSMTVRWINIGGIDWEVLSSVALRYSAYPSPFSSEQL